MNKTIICLIALLTVQLILARELQADSEFVPLSDENDAASLMAKRSFLNKKPNTLNMDFSQAQVEFLLKVKFFNLLKQ
jgi:hypothetical protein